MKVYYKQSVILNVPALCTREVVKFVTWNVTTLLVIRAKFHNFFTLSVWLVLVNHIANLGQIIES